MLYRVLREPSAYERYDASHTHSIPAEDAIAHADDHVFKLFRKLGKEIGLVVPPSGPSMRLTLPSYLVRFLVAALIKPGTRVRLDEFYRRIFAHYGIAISSRALSEALSWLGDSMDTLGISQDSMWFEEELQRGGLLIALSDAVSMVENPYRSLQEQTT
jgi:hypothetical protein